MTTPKLFIGIDPGVSGGIAVSRDGVMTACKMPETPHDVADVLRQEIGSSSCLVTIEQVGPMPKQGVSSTFKFGRSYGFLEGVLVGLQVPYQFATPQKWQKAMNCMTKGDKNVSKAAAQRRWPKQTITHAKADAMLICQYAVEMFDGREAR